MDTDAGDERKEALKHIACAIGNLSVVDDMHPIKARLIQAYAELRSAIRKERH